MVHAHFKYWHQESQVCCTKQTIDTNGRYDSSSLSLRSLIYLQLAVAHFEELGYSFRQQILFSFGSSVRHSFFNMVLVACECSKWLSVLSAVKCNKNIR